MKNTNSTLVIVGMHRSGTSLTASWMSNCGLNLGDRLMDGSVGNPDGHFEDLDFHDFHENVFKEYNIAYGGLKKTPQITLSSYFESRLQAMIHYKNQMRSHWGWKEPRTCLFLDCYHHLLHNPHYLILFRPVDQVVNSLWRRYKKTHDIKIDINCIEAHHHKQLVHDFTESWIQYNEKIIKFVKQLQPKQYRIHSIDSLLEHDISIINWLNESDFKLKKIPFSSIFDSTQFSQEKKSPSYTESQKSRIKCIEDLFFLPSVKEDKYKEIEQLLIAKNKIIARLEGENTTLEGKNTKLTSDLLHKNDLINSAKNWQKNWLHRSLHKWRPHEQEKL